MKFSLSKNMLYIQNTIFLPSEHLRCMTVEVCSELDIFLQTTSQLLDIDHFK